MSNMDVEKLKCVLCHKFPDGEVFECSGQHIGCQSCVAKLNVRLCQCSEYFEKKKSNPIEQLLKLTKAPCPYKEAGCTWHFGPIDLRNHLHECKYRPYRCIATKLNVLSCSWNGLQHEIGDHLKNDHALLGPPFSYYQVSEIPFSAVKSMGSIKLVDAFNKQFLFYFFSNAVTEMVNFMILYFGRREDARQYYYEFEIQSRNEHEIRRIKFVEQCVADCEDIQKKLEDEKCIAVSFKMIKHFLDDGKIPFRFIVKKLEKEPIAESRVQRPPETGSKQTKPKPTPFVFAQKGKLKGNLNRSASAASFTSSSGGGAGNAGGSKKSPSDDTPLRKISAPAKVTTMLKSASIWPEHRTPDFSSINRIGVSGQDSPIVHQEPSPLMSPSINRMDAVSKATAKTKAKAKSKATCNNFPAF